MSMDVYKVIKEIDTQNVIEIIDPCMDDFLYIFDLQKNTMKISQSAVGRFLIPDRILNNASDEMLHAIYEEDRAMLAKHMRSITEGKEKIHNLHYRWLDKMGMPVWINCRGVVIDDENGRPGYLIGCLNETGKPQRADNVSGLLGGLEFCSYLRSQAKPITHGFLMHIGIDNFGAINGASGSLYGDYILKSVADCMTECLSGGQRLYHLVADQYVIADLESHTKEDAVQLRKRICDRIEDFIVAEKYETVFTVSVGVIDAETISEGYEECRKKFEFSLKQAKTRGKKGFYFFNQEDYESFLQKEKIVAALRDAIANQFEGFEVYYQPIVDCASRRIIGAEALMRFSMISEGEVERISPFEFIPLLEETSLIIPAGRYILSEAAKMCRKMQQYIPGFKMNINISYVQILQGKIADKIISAIQENELKPECICVEMTESGFMDMTPAFCEFREKLEENGIPFVIDDFGTGYSNLHCIRDMNPGYVKMDKDFTSKAMSNKRDYELFEKIIEMVHCIGIKICIEGIERGEWQLAMKRLKADYLQGYFFGKPCSKTEFIEQFV